MSLIYDALEPIYRRHRATQLRIIGPRRRLCCRVALVGTYRVKKFTGYILRRRINTVQRLWADRLWQLISNDLWLPTRNAATDQHEVNLDQLAWTYKFLARCRPRVVLYANAERLKENPKQFKTCKRYNICPHCWSAVTSHQCRYIKELINNHINAKTINRLLLTVQVSEIFVSSMGVGGNEFATPARREAAAQLLMDTIKRYKAHLKTKYRTTNRNTQGSIWRIVVVPENAGWRVQLRQLFLTEPGKSPPADRPRGSRLVTKIEVEAVGGRSWHDRKTIYSEDEDKIYGCVERFNRYPFELLTHDPELVAIYLNSTSSQRLLGGTGKFQSIGDRLVRRLVAQNTVTANAARRA